MKEWLAWQEANGRSLRKLEAEQIRLADRPQSAGRSAQIEAQIAQIRAQEPERDIAVDLCIAAWNDCWTCRDFGMGIGPIPFTAINAWCDRRGFDDEATRIMNHVLRQLDNDRAEAEFAKAELEKAVGARGRK